MKALNTVKFIAEAAERLAEHKAEIRKAETLKDAKSIGTLMLGYIDAMITFNNALIAPENNDLTAELGEVIDEWRVSVYQEVVDAANRLGESNEVIWQLCQKRDEARAA